MKNTNDDGQSIDQRTNELAQQGMEVSPITDILMQEFQFKASNRSTAYQLAVQAMRKNHSSGTPATKAQIDYIINLGYEPKPGLTLKNASSLIDAIKNGEAEAFGYQKMESPFNQGNEVY